MAWHGMACHGILWHGMVWHVLAWSGVLRRGAAGCGMCSTRAVLLLLLIPRAAFGSAVYVYQS